MQPWPLLFATHVSFIFADPVAAIVEWRKEDLREDETVSVQPLGVLGVELHEFVEENVGNRCHAPGNRSANNFS